MYQVRCLSVVKKFDTMPIFVDAIGCFKREIESGKWEKVELLEVDENGRWIRPPMGEWEKHE